MLRAIMGSLVLSFYSATLWAEAPTFHFEEVVLDANAAERTCYAVVPADMNGDGREDIVVVTDNRVQWYACPTPADVNDLSKWAKHVIIENQTELDNVCIAPHDIDGDGKIDFALGAGWTKVGTIQWITRRENPKALWSVHQIAVEPWTHRMRFANVLGLEQPQLVVSPLNATQGNGVRLTAYAIPKNPKTDRWQPTIINDELNRMHNHWHLDVNQDGKPETLTASQEGIFLFEHSRADRIGKRQLHTGIAGDKPTSSGAGEVKSGNLQEVPFLCTIEPMHGTSVVVYPNYLSTDRPLKRVVLDDSYQQGHAVFTADMNGDGRDEVIAAHREPGSGDTPGPGVYLYHATNSTGSVWARTPIDVRGLDGGMACEDLMCLDLNNDQKPDIVAVGRKTKNVKIYLNQTPSASDSK